MQRFFVLSIPPRQFQPHIIQSECFCGSRSALGQMEVLGGFIQRMFHIILKAETIPEVCPSPAVNPLQGGMDFFVGFFVNIYLLRVFRSGVSDKFMLALIFVFYNLIQTDDASQILRFKSGIPSADVVHHSVADSRCCIG